MNIDPKLFLYLVPLAVIYAVYLYRHRAHREENIAVRDASKQAGLNEPASLHPVINPLRCIGCGACANACPEGKVIGLIGNKAELINPSHCIGHGACKAACPADAITLVFGSEKRGVDIPLVHPNFETNVPGLFIAGELGGMGLIRNAIEQGRQALESIRKLAPLPERADHDVVIVGAGPAGFSASLAAMQHKLRYITIEQDTLGGTVAHFPRGKIVMTAPVDLPMVGKVKLTETTKEALIDLWREVERSTGVRIRYQERMDDIQGAPWGYTVKTARGVYKTRAVLLAIGRRGTPRKLDVPGEESPKVVYRLIDAEQYRGMHVLVVGGGDSALEAALSVAEQPGATVTLSYRSEAFSRVKEKNRQRLREAEQAKRLRVMLKSTVKQITPGAVQLDWEGQSLTLPNQAVIVCAGGVLPDAFLKKTGITVETKYGTA